MQIIHVAHTSGKGIFAKAKPVTFRNWQEAKRIGKEMVAWVDEMQGHFIGNYHNAWAISHAQVAEEPLAMFVIAAEFVGKDEGQVNRVNTYWRSRVIYNPKILETPEFLMVSMPKRNVKRVGSDRVEVETVVEDQKKPNIYTPQVKEACMSFPYRTGKHMKRYFRIKVAYDTNVYGIKIHHTEWIEGVKAHIFQHEMEHQKGVNMIHG